MNPDVRAPIQKLRGCIDGALKVDECDCRGDHSVGPQGPEMSMHDPLMGHTRTERPHAVPERARASDEDTRKAAGPNRAYAGLVRPEEAEIYSEWAHKDLNCPCFTLNSLYLS